MHIQKLKLQASKMIIGHDLRTHENYSNKGIDLSKSKNNVIYCDRGADYLASRSNKIYIYGKNGKHKNDLNYTCSVVVQLPKNCKKEELFFDTMNDYLNNKFGAKNCVCSVVHRDEAGQPHLHYVFMPVVAMDKAKNGYTEKLCAKEVINREMLLGFHKEAEQWLAEWGCPVKLTLEENENRDYINTVEEYKKAQDINKQLIEQNKQILNEFNSMVIEYNKLVEDLAKIKHLLKTLDQKYNIKSENVLDIIESVESRLTKNDHQINR